MNKNEPSRRLQPKNKLRNAFIHKPRWELKKEMSKMKKSLTIFLLAVLVISSVGLAVSVANASMLMGFDRMGSERSVNDLESASMSNRLIQRSWVRIHGVITQWGTTDVRGSLFAWAKTAIHNATGTRNLAFANAMWTTNTSRPIDSDRAKENFTYTFYSAKLLNASVSTLSSNADSFFLNGTWRIHKVTSNTTIITDTNGEIISIHRVSDTEVTKAYGELNVTDNWTKFKLSLTGMDPLTGTVVRSAMRQMQFNPFHISESDDVTGTEAVTKTDLTTVVKSYRAMPGWGNYDSKMDFNLNYKIDIADLSTVAANVQ